MVTWRGDRGGIVESYRGVHIVTVMMVVIQEGTKMVGIRVSPGVVPGVVVVMGGECK